MLTFHPRPKSWQPASALRTRGDRGEFTGWGSQGPHSRAGGPPHETGGCWALRRPRRGHSASSHWDSTQPGRSFWPSLAAHLQREPRFPPEPLCQAQESTKGKSALDLGFAGLQGPGRVGWAPAGKERPGEGKADWRVPAVAAASTQHHQHTARPHRLRTLPRAWPFGPYISAGPEAGRGGAGGTRGGAARGVELLPGRCSSVFLGKTNGEHR